jgi:histidine triad (HIT) family protein
VDCIFCKIVSGAFDTELLAENEQAIAFKDINPQANVHVLVVPRSHTSDISQVSYETVLSGLFDLIRKVAEEQTDGQFRLQFNTGSREGQSVFHTHAHILSAKAA